MTRADDRNFATWADGGGTAPNREPWLSDGRCMTDHEHNWDYVSPGRRKCYGCGARLAVEVQFHEAPHSTTLGEPTLRGSDVTWAQQFRPDRKGRTDG